MFCSNMKNNVYVYQNAEGDIIVYMRIIQIQQYT